MSHRRWIPAALIAAACCGIAWAGELTQTVSFDRKNIVITSSGGYDIVDLAGCQVSVEPGAPRLPHLIQAVALPAGAVLTGADLIGADEQPLDGSYSIAPIQRQVPLPMPGKTFTVAPAAPDPAIYGQDAVYPAAVVRSLATGSLCGYCIGHVLVSPLRYNPATRTLYFSQRITYRVRYQEGASAATIPTSDQQALFGQQAKLLVANPGDVDRFAPQVSRARSKALPAGTYRAVIISGLTSCDSVFARLAAWHTKKGLRDTVVTLSSITSGYTGYDAQDKIRNFIKDAKNTWGTTYVLLGGKGDAMGSARNIVPCRKAWYSSQGGPDNDSIPSDWYYADLD
ncbi:MAG TPA: C25 family cysteine peptidase, partial [Candidatus Edwardsbacteria bacterium]|nr:C25 family cysteine peptidase [Candidatus Edwardsbacteria bacterium]